MINEALTFLCHELNTYIKVLFNINEDKVVLSSPLTSQGLNNAKNTDKLIITLVNIEQEATIRNSLPGKIHSHPNPGIKSGDIAIHNSPALNINLHLLFSTSFNDYQESLKFISCTLSFFQSKGVFTHQNAPLLNTNIEKLVVELENINYQNSNYLWAMLGSNYTPSVIYKVRMLTTQ